MKYTPKDYARLLYASNNMPAVLALVKHHWVYAWLPEIIREYETLARKEEHIAQVRVLTARPVSQEIQHKINTMIARYYPNHTLDLRFEVDAGVLGGFRAESDRMIIKGSLADQLAQLFS